MSTMSEYPARPAQSPSRSLFESGSLFSTPTRPSTIAVLDAVQSRRAAAARLEGALVHLRIESRLDPAVLQRFVGRGLARARFLPAGRIRGARRERGGKQ